MSVSTDPRIGSELVGYRIEMLLGRGGMGVVYRAEDLALERKVALKLLAPELAEDTRFRERFQRESRLAASIDHPAIVPVYEAGEVQGQLYIAMRYVEGTDLKALLREGPLEPERALDICSQVADALDSAHERGLVHRDVKPSNVLLDGRGHAYLADFGLTKRSDDLGDSLDSGGIQGTVDYVAPEVIEGRPVDARADLYSLGCLLYETMAGRVPYPRDSELAVLWAHVHEPAPRLEAFPGLDPVLARGLAKEPDKRYSSGQELVAAARQGMPQHESSRRRRRSMLLAATLAVLTALAVALPLTLTPGADGPSTEPTLSLTSHAIQRIDPGTNELAATLRVPVGEFELAAGGGWVWAADVDRSTIFKIDPKRNVVQESIRGIGDPASLGFGAGFLWVLNPRDGIVTQVDPATGGVAGTALLPPGSWTLNAPIRAGDDGIWVAWATDDGNAVRIDPQSLAATPVQVGASPIAEVWDFAQAGPGLLWALAKNPDNLYTDAVLTADPRRHDFSHAHVIPLDATASAVAADRGGVWVVEGDEDQLVRVDGKRQRIGRRISVGDAPFRVALARGAVWVANSGDGTVSRVDPQSGKVVATVRVGPHPGTVAVDENGVWVDVHPS